MATGLENLWIYRLAEDLEIEVHGVTKKFPRDELYRSVDQLRRSSSSAADNIAEAYRRRTVKDKNKHLTIAVAEAEETKRGILKSARKGFLDERTATALAERYTVLIKGTYRYMKFLESTDPRSDTGRTH